MRYVILRKPVIVDGKPYTLPHLARFAVAVAPQFNDNFAAATKGATLLAGLEELARTVAGPDVSEADLGDVVLDEGTVWPIEDEPWRMFLEWCENPALPDGRKGYPIRPASLLVPHIESLKEAKKEPPAKALPPAPDEQAAAEPG